MTLKHRKVTAIPDDAAYDVGSDEWNDDHVVNASDTQVLFVDGATGIVAGDAGLTYDKTGQNFQFGGLQFGLATSGGGFAGTAYSSSGGTINFQITSLAAVVRSISVDGPDTSISGGFEFVPSITNVIYSGWSTKRWKAVYGVTIDGTHGVFGTDAAVGISADTTGLLSFYHDTSAFATSFQAGNAAAAVTYTLPTNVGAAGSVLRDSAGNGTLSWGTGGLANPYTQDSGSSSSIYFEYTQNTPAKGRWGVETGSGAAQIFTGATNNATVFGAVTNHNVEFFQNDTKRLTIGSAAITTAIPLTVTGLTTITQASANAGIIASTGYSLTGSDATGMVNLAGTWNTSGNPVMLKIAMTNTASGATTKFASFLAGAAGATEVFSVGKAGDIFSSDALSLVGTTSQHFLEQTGNSNVTFRFKNNGSIVGYCGYVSGSFGFSDTNATPVLKISVLLATVAGNLSLAGANGQALGIKSLTELLTIAAAVNSTTTIQKPADSIILAVSVRVTTAVTCTTGFTVGDSTGVTRFNVATLVSKAATTTDKGTKAGAYYNATAEGIIITPDTTPSDATGRVRVTIHYIEITPPTS